MFKALVVLFAMAALAFAPAATAAPPASSHKPAHGKGAHAAAEAPSKTAKLRKATALADDEADAAPQAKTVCKGKGKTRKCVKAAAAATHAGKAGKAAKAADAETAEAAPKPKTVCTGKGAKKKCSKVAPAKAETASDAETADAAPKTRTVCKGAGKKRKCVKVAAAKAEKASDAETAEAAPKTKTVCKGVGKKRKCSKVAVAGARKAAAEEAEAEPATKTVCTGKGKKRHCKEVAEARPVASKAGGRSIIAEADAQISARGSHDRLEAPDKGLAIRAELRSTKSCVAAHIKLHGKPKGARGRSALQRECAKEVEAARRRAEEERAIRTWMPPHGPLIYQGAMPHSGNPAPAVSEPPADATPESSTSTADPSPASGAPPKGSAMVIQPTTTAPASGGGFLSNLNPFRRKPAKPTATGPAPTLSALIGADETRLKAELGEPELMRAEGSGALWTYRLPACALVVFLSRDPTPAHGWKVKGAQPGPLKRGGPTPDVDSCLKSARP